MSKIRLTSDGLVDVDYTGIRLTSGGLVKGSASGTPPVDDVLFQNMLHQIDSGLITQTASGLNGVLVT